MAKLILTTPLLVAADGPEETILLSAGLYMQIKQTILRGAEIMDGVIGGIVLVPMEMAAARILILLAQAAIQTLHNSPAATASHPRRPHTAAMAMATPQLSKPSHSTYLAMP
jgi:hypothetical protein